MTYDDDVTPRERKISRALAIGMHVAFVVLLIFGVSWQRRYSEPAAVVDLWSSLSPAKPEPDVEPRPAPKPIPKVEPKPEPKPAPPPPKPEAKPVAKADIALKEKLEKEKKLKEERELEKRKEEKAKAEKQQRELETKKKEEEKKKLEKERLAQETEAKKLAADKQALADKLAKEQAAAQSRLFNEYIARIQQRIKSNIVEPPNLQGNPEVEFNLRLLPGGEVLEPSLRLRRSSGNPAYDQAVERAILKSSPLPLPPDPAAFNMFRELNLKIRPRE